MSKLVLFVGISPPVNHVLSSTDFILTSESGKRLVKWTQQLGLTDNWHAINVLPEAGAELGRTKNVHTDHVRRVSRTAERFKYVVALGSSVFEFLCDVGLNPLRLPHPSGLNREINDKAELERQLKMLKERLK